MQIRPSAHAAAVLLLVISSLATAEERMIAGSERGSDLVATGASDALTSPARLVGEITEETREFGPFGLVSGPVRGSIKAAGQALQGGARMAIGILDALTDPLRGE